MTRVVHDPRECREALARTTAPVVLDLETTGLRRWDQIVSAGLLIDDVAYLLFVRTLHPSITNVSETEFRTALEPLSRPDLVVVGHNLPFDLAFLRREGVARRGRGPRHPQDPAPARPGPRGGVPGAGPGGPASPRRRRGAPELPPEGRRPAAPRPTDAVLPRHHRAGPVRGAPHLPDLRPARDPGPLRLPLAPAGACRPEVLPTGRRPADPGLAGDDRGGGCCRCRLHPRRVRPAGAVDGAAVGGAPAHSRRRAGPGPGADAPVALQDARSPGPEARSPGHAVGPIAGCRGPEPARGVQRRPAGSPARCG